jgi:hypothetical protein
VVFFFKLFATLSFYITKTVTNVSKTICFFAKAVTMKKVLL